MPSNIVSLTGTQSIGLSSTAPFSVPNNAWTTVSTGAAVEFNNGTFYSGSALPSFVVLENSGVGTHLTDISARATFASNNTGLRGIRVLNGAGNVIASSIQGTDPNVAASLFLTFTTRRGDGDTYTLQVYQNSGGALDIGDTIAGFLAQTTLRLIFIAPSN